MSIRNLIEKIQKRCLEISQDEMAMCGEKLTADEILDIIKDNDKVKAYYVVDVEYFEDNDFDVFGEKQLIEFAKYRRENYIDCNGEDEYTSTDLDDLKNAIEFLKHDGYKVKEFDIE